VLILLGYSIGYGPGVGSSNLLTHVKWKSRSGLDLQGSGGFFVASEDEIGKKVSRQIKAF